MPKPKKFAEDLDDLDGAFENDLEEPAPSWDTETPSGGEISLLSEDEMLTYVRNRDRYMEDFSFTNISDLSELDRLLMLEILAFRSNTWLMNGMDYDGNPVLSSTSSDSLKFSKEVREIKAALGIDKKTRDSDKGTSTAAYLDKLRIRAQDFGIHRNNQVIRAHTILKEFQGLVTLYGNCTETERTEFHCHPEDIIETMKERFLEFDEIDAAFLKSQKIWIQELNE